METGFTDETNKKCLENRCRATYRGFESHSLRCKLTWGGAREADWARLLSECWALNSAAGSNPALPAETNIRPPGGCLRLWSICGGKTWKGFKGFGSLSLLFSPPRPPLMKKLTEHAPGTISILVFYLLLVK